MGGNADEARKRSHGAPVTCLLFFIDSFLHRSYYTPEFNFVSYFLPCDSSETGILVPSLKVSLSRSLKLFTHVALALLSSNLHKMVDVTAHSCVCLLRHQARREHLQNGVVISHL